MHIITLKILLVLFLAVLYVFVNFFVAKKLIDSTSRK